jgi:branched-chain amino acid transport system permease protein
MTDLAVPAVDHRRAPSWRRVAPGVAFVVVLAALPFVPVRIPVLFNGPFDAPGTLNLLGLMLVFGCLALSYDLLFGYTGLLSFGHALYFAVGVYTTTIVVSELELALLPAVAVSAGVGLVVSLVLGAISLRVGGIAFAMVTLAFAQAGHIFVLRDPFGITGGEEGRAVAFDQLPDALVGVFNTRNVYWVALAFTVLVYLVARFLVGSRPGHVWQAIRENEQRVEVLGLAPYGFKLLAFVLASVIATMAGTVYVLLVGGANPGVTAATFTLTLLVMVVLGGAGTLWGAVLGGALYTYLNTRLVALSSSDLVDGLPGVVRAPLSEPLFVLGAVFILVVLFFPGGIAGLRDTRVGRRTRELLLGLVDGR